jgi:hypothetical protein
MVDFGVGLAAKKCGVVEAAENNGVEGVRDLEPSKNNHI